MAKRAVRGALRVGGPQPDTAPGEGAAGLGSLTPAGSVLPQQDGMAPEASPTGRCGTEDSLYLKSSVRHSQARSEHLRGRLRFGRAGGRTARRYTALASRSVHQPRLPHQAGTPRNGPAPFRALIDGQPPPGTASRQLHEPCTGAAIPTAAYVPERVTNTL
jgi:hypothetical protein